MLHSALQGVELSVKSVEIYEQTLPKSFRQSMPT